MTSFPCSKFDDFGLYFFPKWLSVYDNPMRWARSISLGSKGTFKLEQHFSKVFMTSSLFSLTSTSWIHKPLLLFTAPYRHILPVTDQLCFHELIRWFELLNFSILLRYFSSIYFKRSSFLIYFIDLLTIYLLLKARLVFQNKGKPIWFVGLWARQTLL